MNITIAALIACVLVSMPFLGQAAPSCEQAIKTAEPSKRAQLANVDKDISKDAFYIFSTAKSGGQPNCIIETTDDSFTIKYQFPSGIVLTLDNVTSLESTSESLTVDGLSNSEADRLLKKEGKQLHITDIDWHKSEKEDGDTVYSGETCNAMGRIMRKDGKVTGLRLSQAC